MRRAWILAAALLVLTLLGTGTALAQGLPSACLEGIAEEGDYLDLGRPDDRFSRCLRAYDSGALGEAVGCLNSLLSDGHDGADVLYNLGNAYYRLDRFDCAVLALRSAELRAPRDPDLAENLASARSRLVDETEPAAHGPVRRALLFWYDGASARELWWGAALLLLAAGGLRLRPRTPARRSIALGLLGAALAGSALVKDLELVEPGAAVVVVAEVAGRSDRDAGSVELFRLHAGAEVVVYEQTPDWTQVALPGGARAWLPTPSLGFVR